MSHEDEQAVDCCHTDEHEQLHKPWESQEHSDAHETHHARHWDVLRQGAPQVTHRATPQGAVNEVLEAAAAAGNAVRHAGALVT